MAEPVPGVHSYWTVPSRHPRAYRQLSRAAWLLSILSWRRYAGPMGLYADRPTVESLDRLGWLGHYDWVEILDDRGLDDRYDRRACFALPKLLSMERYPEAVLIDTDAYLLSEFRPLGEGSLFAHLERGDVDFYSRLGELNNPSGVELPDSLPLVGNTSLFRAADPELARRISRRGLAFLAGNPATPGRDVHLHMTVAEQVLATHLTVAAGRPVVNHFGAVWTLRTRTWLTPRPDFGHLWNLKRAPQAGKLLATYGTIERILRDEYGVDPGHVHALLEQA
jgi:hypothetical protein